MPAHPLLVNEFVWQTEDVVPDIPRVHKFLKFWKENNLAVIQQILISHSENHSLNLTSFYKKIGEKTPPDRQ
jgi:uncharacterized protein Usg